MTDMHLTQEEKASFIKLIGRPIDDKYFSNGEAKSNLSEMESDLHRGRRYSSRVWVKRNIHEYIDSNAKYCAAFAKKLQNNESVVRTYYFNNPHGKRFVSLGRVHLRVFPSPPPIIGLELTEESQKNSISIASIEIHPSLRRQGFLKKLIEELRLLNFHAVALECIQNASLAYHFYKKSLTSDKVILLSGPDSIDFERKVSPCPTFAVLLK